jgi:hypothetical protein
MAISSDTGWKFYIGPVYTAATDTAGEFAALTYVEVGEVESIGPFGDTAAISSFRALANTRTRKTKGTRDAGNVEIVVGRDPLDAGQIAMRAAEQTKFAYAFKIEANDKLDANDTNTFFYFGALVAARPVAAGTDAVRERYQLAIDTAIYDIPATVVP